jgi:transposase-like protein
MNRAEAANAFVFGELHPHCPGCGPGHMPNAMSDPMRRPDGHIWRRYRCGRCGEHFLATVEERVDWEIRR